MNNVENPIIIDQGYCPTHTCKNKKPSNIAISDIQYKNIRGTSSSEVAVSINCSPKNPCKDISLIDINLTGGKITDQFLLVQPSRVQISDVHYRNIRGTSSSENAVTIMCSPQYPCQGVELFNINLRPGGIKGGATASCANAKLTYGGTQVPPPCR
ncbi:hypothetical protein Syun_028764 [Stephania yunnanensis]|uniref:Uncharacterized protein n=1 Tax=Stephania yunnanensis TaxID=152371 RepID=A0AAP0HKS3_9MAGN